MNYAEVVGEGIIFPRKGDAGYDLIAASDPIFNYEEQYIEYNTGVRVAPMQENVHGFVFPRSSISKYWLVLANSVPVIDSSFRGEIKLRFRYLFEMHENKVRESKIYHKGDKIAQLVFLEAQRPHLVKVPSFEVETARGEGGFGSTGN